MLNLRSDLWVNENTPPDWLPVREDGEAHLHLYGKNHARGRRKMCKVILIATTTGSNLAGAEALKTL